MKKVTMYQYAKCGTCRQAVKLLANNGYDVHSIEIFDNPPDLQTLTELIRMSGLTLKKFFNTSGEVYKEMNLKDKLADMSDEEKIALLSSNGRLIKRPIVTDGKQVTVGFKEDQYQDIWS
ncbi:MAG: arsenate reductase family protein [Paenibacillaceae bacterium]